MSDAHMTRESLCSFALEPLRVRPQFTGRRVGSLRNGILFGLSHSTHHETSVYSLFFLSLWFPVIFSAIVFTISLSRGRRKKQHARLFSLCKVLSNKKEGRGKKSCFISLLCPSPILSLPFLLFLSLLYTKPFFHLGSSILCTESAKQELFLHLSGLEMSFSLFIILRFSFPSFSLNRFIIPQFHCLLFAKYSRFAGIKKGHSLHNDAKKCVLFFREKTLQMLKNNYTWPALLFVVCCVH